MIDIKEYHRPNSLNEALELLTRSGLRAALLAGGTTLVPQDDVIDDVIDLQALGLNNIEIDNESFTLGAMCRIQDVVGHAEIPPMLKTAAKREGPNTFRNMGTIGGLIATADRESELYAALLVYEAKVIWLSYAGRNEISLSELNQDMLGDSLITSITFPKDGITSDERIARTPADKPIVSVVGRKDAAGVVRLAACGVAERPILLDFQRLDELMPPGDFRGSSQYRKSMVELLSQRVLANLARLSV